jgi:hypothetical protein
VSRPRAHQDSVSEARHALPATIRRSLVTHTNPEGTLTNSELELAAIILGSSLAASNAQTQHSSILVASDNTPAIAWTNKGSTTSTSTNAYLLHWLARQRRAFSYDLVACYTPGPSNTIADACSRLFHLNDVNFLNHMNRIHPVQPCWTLAQIPSARISELNWALSKQLLQLESLSPTEGLGIPPGRYGNTSAHNCTATPTWHTSMTPSHSYKYSPTATEPAPWFPVGLQSALELWKVPFVPWGRRSPHWDIATQG